MGLRNIKTKFLLFVEKMHINKCAIFAISLLFNFSIFSDLSANPIGGVVHNGNASISASGNQLTIQQTSQKAIIHWDSFNIGTSERTHFQQPAGGIALNRISPTQGASSIYGSLTATGDIILVNPAGIYFGPQAYVNVGGIIATTANITNEHFLQNRYIFQDSGTGKIINQGQIIAAQNGLVALLASNGVENDGTIIANTGNVVLGSAKAYTISFDPNSMVQFTVNEPNKLLGKITNKGKIIADGGRVVLSSHTAKNVLDDAINMKGVVQANSVGMKNGEIIFSGGNVNVSGKIYAQGKKAYEKGGKIKVYAKNLTIENGATLDASGHNGGGEILLGDKNHNILNPINDKTFINKDTFLLADSYSTGNGGKIIVWSDGLTAFQGFISARGGVTLGNGGFIEVSGKSNLQFKGKVDTSAPKGSLGTLLLDPKFIIVRDDGLVYADNINNRFNNNSSSTNVISPLSLALASMTSNILLQANSDVIFSNALTLLGAGSLTVQAGRSILINSNINTNNTSINMTANDSTALSSERSIDNSDNPMGDSETLTGNIIMASGTSLNAGSNNINLTVADSIGQPFFAGNIILNQLNGNGLNITSSNSITVNGAITGNSALLYAKNSGITLNNLITTTGNNYSLVLSGTSFTNNFGSTALNPVNGNFLVWSGSPVNDNRDGINYNFKQYNAMYGVSTPLGTGNGFLYTIAPTISPYLIGNISKIYNRNTTAAITALNYAYDGIIDGDTAVLTQPTVGFYDTRNAGVNKTVTVTGISLLSTTNNGADVYGYESESNAVGNVGTISPATLTASLSGVSSKVYNKTTIANLTSSNYVLSGIISGDSVLLNNPTQGTFDTVNVGSNKLITVTGLGLSGTAATNYVLAQTTISGNIGFIFPAQIVTSLTGSVNKVYDATTTATLAANNYLLSGILSGDNVNLNSNTLGHYDTKNVGTNKLITVTGLSLNGSDASNYQLSSTNVSGNIGVITPASLNASLTGNISKVYDTTTNATLAANHYLLAGVLGGDNVSLNNPISGQYDTKNIGTNKLITVTGLALNGSDAANYQLNSTNISGNIGTITQASLNVSLTGTVSKIYNATTTATLAANNYNISGVLGSDSVSINSTTGQYDTKNVGTNKLVTVNGLALGGSDGGNYQLASSNISGNIGIITPASLNVSLMGNVSKVYDTTINANLAANNYLLSGVLAGDNVDLNNPISGQFNTRHVGINKLISVNGLAISGSDSGNYQLASSNISGNIGTITPAPLGASLTGNVSKVYDTTANATLAANHYILSGILGSDSVLLNNPTAGLYDNKNVGTNKIVTVSGLTLSGADSNDYQLISTNISGNVGTITPATLNASLTGIVSKVYDATTIATLAANNYSLSGILGGEDVTLNNPTSGQYDTRHVGSNKIVSVNGLMLTGNDASNYQLNSTNISGNIGSITPASLSASLTGNVVKIYNTTTTATLGANHYLLSNVFSGDSVGISNTVGQYDNKNVGTNKLVSVNGLILNGSEAGNYQLTSTNISGNVGTITPASLNVSLAGNVSKIYDTTTNATLAANHYVLSGVFGADNVDLNNPTSGQYDTKNVGVNKLITVNGLSLNGSDASNYQLNSNSVSGNIGSITPASLNASLTGSIGRVYNATTTATIAANNYLLSGVLGGDNVNITNTSGQYDTRNVGTNKSISVAGLTLGGGDASNYQLTSSNISANIGTITPATLNVSLTGNVSKVYDATTNATLGSNHYVLSGILSGDSVSLNNPVSGQYDTRHVGINKLVTVDGLALNGSDSANYLLASTNVSGNVGVITPASLSASITGTVSKIYDATTTATLAANQYVLSGVLGSDSVSLNNPTNGQFDTKNVGTNKIVTVNGLVLNGSDANNYQLINTNISNSIGEITPATLIVSLTGTVSKVYDATTLATLAANNYQLSGVFGNDSVIINNTMGEYDTPAVGINKLVSVSGLMLSGSDANNYQLTSTNISNNVGEITASSTTTPNTPNTNQGNSTDVSTNTLSLQNATETTFEYSSQNIDIENRVVPQQNSIIGSMSGSTSNSSGTTSSGNEMNPNNNYSQSNQTNSFMNNSNLAQMSQNAFFNTSNAINSINNFSDIKSFLNPINYGLNQLYSTQMNVLAMLKQHSKMISSTLAGAATTGLLFFMINRRRKYLTDLSFKLRTSLETIMGFSSLLYQDKVGHTPDQQKEFLKYIMDGAKGILAEVSKVELHNIFVPTAEMAFNLRIGLQDIIGFATLINTDQRNLTTQQKDLLSGILTGSNDILKLIPVK